jgi:hypothetical protein
MVRSDRDVPNRMYNQVVSTTARGERAWHNPGHVMIIIVLCCLLIAPPVLSTLLLKSPHWPLVFLASIPLSVVGYFLIVKYFDRIFLAFLIFTPFYYAPTLVAGAQQIAGTEDEGFWLRAGKDVVILILFTAWVNRSLLRGRISVRNPEISFLVATYILWGTLRGVLNGSEFFFSSFRIFTEFAILFFIAQDVFRCQRTLERQVLYWVYASVIVSLIGIVEYFTVGDRNYFSRAAGQIRIISTLFNPNALGWYLLFATSLAFGFLSNKLNPKRQFVLVVVILINIAAIYLSGSRSALIVSVLSFLFSLLLNRNGRHLALGMMTLFIVLTIFLTMLQNSEVVNSRIFVLPTRDLRIDILSRSLSILSSVSVIELFTGTGTMTLEIARDYALLSDSQYNSVVFYGGIVGLLLLIMIIAISAMRLLVLSLKMRGIYISLLLALCSLVVTGVGANILTLFPHAVYFWIIVGITASSTKKPQLGPNAS